MFISIQILVPRDIKLVVSLPKGLGEKTINTTNLETVSSVINTIAEEMEEHSSRISLKVRILSPPPLLSLFSQSSHFKIGKLIVQSDLDKYYCPVAILFKFKLK